MSLDAKIRIHQKVVRAEILNWRHRNLHDTHTVQEQGQRNAGLTFLSNELQTKLHLMQEQNPPPLRQSFFRIQLAYNGSSFIHSGRINYKQITELVPTPAANS